MSAVTVPVHSAKGARLRPLPWRRMVWVSWRHHRVALGGVAVFLGALAVWLWISGLQLHHAYAAAAACHPASSSACQNLIATFQSTNVVLKGGFVLQPVPALIGAFVAAPMLAREIETGTFRYAWTQGFGRRRWTLAKLVLVGVAVAAIAGAFSVLVSWYYQPYLASGNGTQFSSPSPLSPGLFDLRSVAFAGWTFAAFAIGAVAGVLIRRVVPAIVATLAAYTGLALLAANVLRQRYLTPLVASGSNLPTGGILKAGFVLQPVPALIGAFVGPLVLARELETGTFRYAWTQAFGRWRWTLAKLVLLAVAVTAVSGAFSVLVSWYYQPYLTHGRLYSATSPLHHWLFDLRGVAFAAWTLTAFAMGALASMLIRQVVPAIAATLAGYTGLAVVAGDVLRANYQPASHFWRVQWIEGGGLLALSALLIAVTVWLVHRRAT